MDDATLLRHLRALVQPWPEVAESVTFGSNPTFKAGRKAFAVLDRYQGVGCLCLRTADAATRARLLRQDRFFEPPYDPRKVWIALRLDGVRGVRELQELCLASYRTVALARMLSVLDGKGAKAAVGRRPSRQD